MASATKVTAVSCRRECYDTPLFPPQKNISATANIYIYDPKMGGGRRDSHFAVYHSLGTETKPALPIWVPAVSSAEPGRARSGPTLHVQALEDQRIVPEKAPPLDHGEFYRNCTSLAREGCMPDRKLNKAPKGQRLPCRGTDSGNPLAWYYRGNRLSQCVVNIAGCASSHAVNIFLARPLFGL